MADVGILTVGPAACALFRDADLPVPVHRVRAEAIAPLETDQGELARQAGLALFTGADADRWVLLPPSDLAARTGMLWAASQVASADPERLTDGWQAVLVVAMLDEPALLPTVRALGGARPVTVLLGGRALPDDPAARRNHVVLAELLRRRSLAAVIHTSDPDRVVEVALDTARTPTVSEVPRRKAVDIGPALELPATWVIPAPPVTFSRLVHIPLGQSARLTELVVDLAAHEALREMLTGPPVDVAGVAVADLDALRSRLPVGDVFEDLRQRVLRALDTVEFVGEEPLVEAVARSLRPVSAYVREVLALSDEIAAARISALRAFGAAGIEYTAQRLRVHLDDVTESRRPGPSIPVDALLDGEVEATDAGVDPLAWRQAFAGVPCYVVRRGQPGWQIARQMVQDRFSQFKAAFAAAVARNVEERVTRAADPDAPLDPFAVRSLHDRAARVRHAVRSAHLELNGRILASCEAVVQEDGFVRWATGGPEQLRERLEGMLHRLAVASEMERAATVAFTRRPLGMADPGDFDAWLAELVEAARSLPRTARAAPSYPTLLRALFGDLEPESLRAHLTSAGVDPVLSLQKGTPAELMTWFERTGMRIEVRAGPPCAVAWGPSADLTSAVADAQRSGATEHRLSDLVAPPPDGDTPQGLAALAEAVVTVITGVLVGELQVTGDEGVRALLVAGEGMPPESFLPHGAIHDLTVDRALREGLAGRVQARLHDLAAVPDAAEALQKLVELAELGPSPRVVAQLGLDHPRYKHLMPAISSLLRRACKVATVAVLDHLRVDEVRALVAPPTRHAVIDVLQLAPLGGA